MSLHILSYNIHWGLSAFRRSEVVENISKVIQATAADIVLLQELWLPQGAMDFIVVDSLKHVWPHQFCTATAIFPNGEQGNGILSRHEIRSWHHQKLGYQKRQERAFLHARLWIESEQRTLSLFCTHFGLLRKERLYQAEELCSYIETHVPREEAIVLGGDFNDWRSDTTAVFRERAQLEDVFLQHTGRYARTYPATYPLLPLDRIYARGLDINEVRVVREAGWRGSSDHLPLSADLSFP
jgi:endonuclease/exonuclease/phosphatase family metal-dependent hydrolase